MVAVYVRVSTQEQAREGYSVGEQIDRLRKYCEAMRWEIYNVYTDAGISGATVDRPALQEMIRAAETGKIDRVLVYKLDRLSRSQLDTLFLIEKVFLANGVDFVSMSENFDTSTPFGRAMVGILAVFAQLEREQIRERMTMGKDARIREGKWTGGPTPYGYDYKDKQLVINEDEADLVREMFRSCVSGKPLFRIQEDFNAAGYTFRGRDWSLWSIRYMLTNRVYAGYVRHRDEWIRGIHEPIIDEETFAAAERIMLDNRQRFIESGVPVGGKTRSTYLGGLIYCAHCGGKYGKRQAGSPGQRYYTYVCYSRCKKVRTMIKDPTCRNKIYRCEELDGIVFDEIRKLALDPDALSDAGAPADDETKKIRLLETEVKNVDAQISRFMDLYGLGRFSVEQLDAKLLPLEERRNKLNAEIRAISAPKRGLSDDVAAALITSFGDVLDHGDFHEIRSVIESLIERIVIDGENVNIHWRFA